ncbi:hypothetical protein MJO28_012219 [Puccinia striiformis f. sp. tritici]|uniref:Uncharacterized protein n=1 Tax=Puccinia striiformis f. sp. tritici TaxID=168172 RepID=A0ACC0DZQ7_9BASI|nr:hypothetical protein MJO28_012219 [Puccinia striiformis f. sp. tritici]
MSWGPQKSCGSLPLKHLNRRDLASTSSGRPAFLDPNRLERLTHRKVPSHKSPDNLSREQNQASS